ncbi:replication factor A protein 3 [Xylaria longipes]|nr:replication factor A protein 3 [Xylaria longipes]
MESVSTPRISANMLPSYVGQNVIIVGKVSQLRGESALLEANGEVNAILNYECHLMAGNGAQIIGRVNPDLSVKVHHALDLGNNVAIYALIRSLVMLSASYDKPHLCYPIRLHD